MKFHCDRCKTRYSISAERVRGKILKIRCKNCSAVITVREGMDGAAEAAPGRPAARTPSPSAPERPALAGAFATALERQRDPSASDSLSAAPASLEAEWYVAIDGDQHGPLSLEAARAWIRERSSDDEIFCWSEGFDDWLRVEKVSHFRGLPRRGDDDLEDERTVIDPGAGSGPARPPAVPPGPPEETPKPLFAATMAAVEAEAPTVAEDEALPDPLAPKVPSSERNGIRGLPPADEAAGDLDFDIGEASRVVELPMLARQLGEARGAAGASARSGGLPGTSGPAAGLGRGSGSQTALGAASAAPEAAAEPAVPQLLQPGRRRALVLPLAIGGTVLVAAVAVLLIVLAGGDDGDTERSTIARGSVGGGGNLGYTFTDEVSKAGGAVPGEAPEAEAAGGGAGAKGRAAKRPASRASGGRKTTSARSGGAGATPARGGEVDLSGSGTTRAAGPLDGDDLMKVYRSNQYLMKRCYERALKKDPFLEVSKTWVSITVAKTGQVTTVSIPTLEGSDLGTCLTSIIRRWKFRSSSEVFNTRFPVVFGS